LFGRDLRLELPSSPERGVGLSEKREALSTDLSRRVGGGVSKSNACRDFSETSPTNDPVVKTPDDPWRAKRKISSGRAKKFYREGARSASPFSPYGASIQSLTREASRGTSIATEEGVY
jgi:hypothetical protein